MQSIRQTKKSFSPISILLGRPQEKSRIGGYFQVGILVVVRIDDFKPYALVVEPLPRIERVGLLDDREAEFPIGILTDKVGSLHPIIFRYGIGTRVVVLVAGREQEQGCEYR